jgi:hypothetical protein
MVVYLASCLSPRPLAPNARVRPLVAPRAQLMISQADAQDLGLFGKYAVTSADQLLSTRAQFRHSNPIL